MKIIILNGSPRKKGNVGAIINSFVNGCLSNEECQVEVLETTNLNLKFCSGCGCCQSNGGKCVLKDDCQEIMEKISSSDMIVFASPVYWMNISAQLKVVVDRMYSIWEKLQGKKIGVFVVGADEVEHKQFDIIKSQFECFSEFVDCEMAFFKKFSAEDEGDILEDSSAMEEVFLLGKNILQ